jgi:hypothetical protein
MLEGLDEIDWGQLDHAYGAATNVPNCLRALASPRRNVRARALEVLHGNIWHQGTVYPATAYAVPFLVEFLREPTVQDRDQILSLLHVISQGNSYLEVHQKLDFYRQERRTAAFQEQLRDEVGWARKARAAVSAGVPVYRELLEAPSLKLRVWSAYLLANCTDRFPEVAAVLRGRLRREPHPLAGPASSGPGLACAGTHAARG